MLESTRTDLLALRSDNIWFQIVGEADEIRNKLGIPLNSNNCNKQKRNHALSKKLSDYFVMSTSGKLLDTDTVNDENSMRKEYCLNVLIILFRNWTQDLVLTVRF